MGEPIVKDVAFIRGDGPISIVWKTSRPGQNFTSATARSQWRNLAGQVALDLHAQGLINVIAPALGEEDVCEVHATIPYEETQNLQGTFVYDVEVTTVSGLRETLFTGNINVLSDITT